MNGMPYAATMRPASACTSAWDDRRRLPLSQSAHSRPTVDTVPRSATTCGSNPRRRADADAESGTAEGFSVALRTSSWSMADVPAPSWDASLRPNIAI